MINVKKLVVVTGVLFIAGILGGSLFALGVIRANTTARTIETAQSELIAKEAELAELKKENGMLKDKLNVARAYATFLSLALCPTLESADKDAPCMKDGAEWLNQTVQAGMSVPDDTIKESLGTFFQTLGMQKRTSSKQFYELLKPLEAHSLRMIVEGLN